MPRALNLPLIRILLVLGFVITATELLAQQKSPIPDVKALEQGQKAAREIYGTRFGQAKTAADKLALAKEMLDTASKVPDGSADQYALLKIAKDVAAGAGDVPTTLGAVERLAERFDVPVAKLKAEALLALARQTSRSTQQKAVAEAAVKILDDLATADEYEAAISLCETAQTCARAARQSALSKELNGRAEDLKQQEAAFQEYRKALAVLEDSPTDAAANLATGLHLCFIKRDWDHGISMLALGSNANLQAVATKDLQGANSADEQVALGDAWWTLAETRSGREKESLRLRAGSWYQQAQPNLAAGLARVKIAKRLAELPKAGADLPKPSPEPSPKPSPKPSPAPALAVAPFDEKKAKGLQIQWSKHLKVPVEQTNSIGLKLVLIPPGEFGMGSTPEEVAQILEEGKRENAAGWYLDRVSREAPKHRVKITKPFYLGLYEVTQTQYEQVLGNNPSKFKGEGSRPVESVSWDDAVKFCRRLSELPREQATDAAYRLPTEGEWEYACRAGATTRYSFGDDAAALGQYAWWSRNSQGRTQPVGRLRPNAWGLCDMHGNVWEWCADWWAADYYAKSPTDDPWGPNSGSHRVLRGGASKFDNPVNFQCTFCNHDLPVNRYEDYGFRVVRAITP
ncbi:MAG: formylglycine-generating enzyme family protein [Planctomycetota bacterium]|nr:formylglycine-generating enzyme family protein [Planctomycetota bacterium]